MSIDWIYFSDNDALASEFKNILEKDQFSITKTNHIERLYSLLSHNQQTVLFLKAERLYNVYDLCQEVSALYPHVYIIIIVPEQMENLKKAMQVGASDTLRASLNHEEVVEAIEHAKKYMKHRTKAEPVNLNLSKEKSRVIAITSPKGGVGRTSLTINLAISFAKMGKKVAIIDANLQFGEVAMYCNIKPKRSIYEWVKEAYGRSNNPITHYMAESEFDVSVLAAPSRPEFFEGITEQHIKGAIEETKKDFDIVLIDMPTHLSEIHLRCLHLADDILLLTSNELSVLRLSKLYLETLESIQLKDKAKLIINRFAKGQSLEMPKIEEIFELEIYHSLPEQSNVVTASVNAGYPYVLSNARSHIGKAVLKLSEKLFEETNEKQPELKKEKRWFLLGK